MRSVTSQVSEELLHLHTDDSSEASPLFHMVRCRHSHEVPFVLASAVLFSVSQTSLHRMRMWSKM